MRSALSSVCFMNSPVVWHRSGRHTVFVLQRSGQSHCSEGFPDGVTGLLRSRLIVPFSRIEIDIIFTAGIDTAVSCGVHFTGKVNVFPVTTVLST